MRYFTGRAVAVAALLSLGATGCGSEEQLPPPPGNAAGGALAQWTVDMCESVAAGTEVLRPVDPEKGDPSSDEIFRAYADDFYGIIASGQQQQLEALDELGPPPREELRAAYDKAMKRLKRSRRQMDAAAETLRQGPRGAQTIFEAQADLALGFYGGFVPDMAAADESIQQVVGSAASCAQFQAGRAE